GRHIRSRSGFVSTALKLPSMRAEERSVTENAWRWIFELNLEAVAHEPVVELPLGTQKRVELARALATDPQLLLLDEPAGGFAHEAVAELELLIRRIRDEYGITI